MKVLIIFAHPNPLSFTRAILDHFVKGLKEAGHQYEVVDLYKIRFNPVFQDMDYSSFVDKDIPKDIFQQMDIRKLVIELAGGPLKRIIARMYIKNKTDDDLIKLINSQIPKDVQKQQKKVAEADVLVFITQVFWMHFPALVKGWMERVLTYGFAYKLNENGWKGDPDGRIPLLKIKKAIIIHPTFFNEQVYREKGFKVSMEKSIDDWSLKYPGVEKVDHIYFHSILAVSDETRKKYLEIACLKGKNLDLD
ncbi:MAG TPA: NAD(P)H-dependent oxidoreductase [Bacteroidales bacterium]|nr:NAD(P)H-dependent oxidoreductase [Bacteroidales bacterium]HPI87627.1 NAD(P)H-dependent oxidoreductase [Bacteroidales bacterium]